MINVGIFCGGYSSEYDISIKSATTILENVKSAVYNAFLVRVDKDAWIAEYSGEEAEVSLNDLSFTLSSGEKIKIDIAHIYIHGNPGENGQLQAFFEMKDLPFINASSLSSSLSFDKWMCNQFLKSFNVKVADAIVLTRDTKYTLSEIGEQLKYPLFVKPTDSGSSYGISKVYKEEDLQKAIDYAFAEGETVICEAFMDGIEVTCAVYRDKAGSHALPCVEIVPDADFFDYEAKYEGKSEEIVPARISDELTKRIQDLTIKIYDALQLRSVARVDYMVVDGEPLVIEVNTTPGFTPESLVPKMLRHAGITISDFWKDIYDFERK